jgi:predicted TIM-barrel fold metal-dependent hydrolase
MAAATEINRVGDHPQVAAVNLSPRTNRPLGNKEYDPIYEAAVENDLAVTLHPGYGAAGIHGQPPTAAGYPTMNVETRLVDHTVVQSHVTSLVFEGAFEKHPELRVACLDCGWSWMSGFFWRLNTEWKNLRTEVPWVTRDPTEYVQDHVRFTVRPASNFESNPSLEAIFDWIGGEELLMYGSNFPHEGVLDPKDVLPSAVPAVRDRILSENAAEFFRFQ